MKRLLGCLAALGVALLSPRAHAADATDPIGDLIARASDQLPSGALSSAVASSGAIASRAAMMLQARLYYAGGRGIRGLDSLGCRVSAMRTLAVDPRVIPRRTIVFIKETVGMLMPNGRTHDGYWYASDIGGGIKGSKVDLFTGQGSGSMRPFFARRLNAGALTATPVGMFQGCPPA